MKRLRFLNPYNWTLLGYPRYIRHIPARLYLGFWPAECWNLDRTLAKFILPRLKYFRNNLIKTTPTSFDRKFGRNKALVKWEEAVDEMLFSMEAICNESEIDWIPEEFYSNEKIVDWNEYDTKLKKVKKGLRRFGYWFLYLWD